MYLFFHFSQGCGIETSLYLLFSYVAVIFFHGTFSHFTFFNTTFFHSTFFNTTFLPFFVYLIWIVPWESISWKIHHVKKSLLKKYSQNWLGFEPGTFWYKVLQATNWAIKARIIRVLCWLLRICHVNIFFKKSQVWGNRGLNLWP